MYYEAIGSVRGSCGHRHRSADKAAECAERDRKACRSLGGGAYSDRRTVRRSDGELYGVIEVLEGLCVARIDMDRITTRHDQMGGAPCIRWLRIPVKTVARMVANGLTNDDILDLYPDIEVEDITAATDYARDYPARLLCDGDRVSGGEPGTEDYDTGRVLDVDGDRVLVGWDSGVRTWTPAEDLQDS